MKVGSIQCEHVKRVTFCSKVLSFILRLRHLQLAKGERPVNKTLIKQRIDSACDISNCKRRIKRTVARTVWVTVNRRIRQRFLYRFSCGHDVLDSFEASTSAYDLIGQYSPARVRRGCPGCPVMRFVRTMCRANGTELDSCIASVLCWAERPDGRHFRHGVQCGQRDGGGRRCGGIVAARRRALLLCSGNGRRVDCVWPAVVRFYSLGRLVEQGLYGTVFVVGVLGNSLVIYVVLRYSKMQTVTNLYILNLAVADQCFLIGIPFIMTTMGLGCWPFGNVMCKASHIPHWPTSTCSNVKFTAISVTSTT